MNSPTNVSHVVVRELLKEQHVFNIPETVGRVPNITQINPRGVWFHGLEIEQP